MEVKKPKTIEELNDAITELMEAVSIVYNAGQELVGEDIAGHIGDANIQLSEALGALDELEEGDS